MNNLKIFLFFVFLLSSELTDSHCSLFVFVNAYDNISLYYDLQHNVCVVANFTSYDIYNKQIKIYQDVEFNVEFEIKHFPAYYDYYGGNIITYEYLIYTNYLNKSPKDLKADLFYLNLKSNKKYYYIFKNFNIVYETTIRTENGYEKQNLTFIFEPLYFTITFTNNENGKIYKSIDDLWTLVLLHFSNDKINSEYYEVNIRNFNFCFYKNNYDLMVLDDCEDDSDLRDIFLDAFYDLEDILYVDEHEIYSSSSIINLNVKQKPLNLLGFLI